MTHTSNDWGPWWFFQRGTTAASRYVDPTAIKAVGPLHGTWYEAQKQACAKLGLSPADLEWTTDRLDPRIPKISPNTEEGRRKKGKKKKGKRNAENP